MVKFLSNFINRLLFFKDFSFQFFYQNKNSAAIIQGNSNHISWNKKVEATNSNIFSLKSLDKSLYET